MKTKTLKFSALAVIVFVAVSVVSCSAPKEVEQTTLIDKLAISNEDTTDGAPKFEGGAHGGKYFSHTDKAGPYGSTVVYTLPDSLVQKDIRVKLNMWVRQGDTNPKNQFAVALQSVSGEMVLWSDIRTQKHVSETNKWINVNDSITIPGNVINKAGLILKMFPFNPEGTSFMDVDDVEISIFKVEKKTVE
jgi:hypothetical protein